MEEENILLNIEFNNEDIKQAVANISNGRKAIDSLIEANKKLVEQGQKNSKEYVQNQESIKALNGELVTNSKIVQANSQAVEVNAKSIEGLKARNKELLEIRNKVTTDTEEGRAEIKKLNAEYDENSKVIVENSTKVEQQRFNIGNYVKEISFIPAHLQGVTTGLQAAVKGQTGLTTASKAFIATGIGAVIAAVGLAFSALMAYLEGSEEGQDKLNKIMAIGSAIMEQFMNVVEAVGEAIFNAIENPQQAIKDFGNALKENITNRVEGMLELFPALGKAVSLLFEGKFGEAAITAGDAVAKVTLGVENASAKITGLIMETTAMVQKGIDNGKKLAELQSSIDKQERKLVEDRAKTALSVSKIRAEAIKLEGDAKKKAISEAIALEEGLSKREVELAKTQQALAELKIAANGDDKAALNDLAAARAKVSQEEEKAFSNTLRFRKELEGLDEEELKKLEEMQKIRDELNTRDQEAENKLALMRLARQAREIEGVENKTAKLIELEELRAKQLLDNDKLIESERQLIVATSEEAISQIKADAATLRQEEERAALNQSLVDYKEYVQGLVNEEKEKLLQGLITQEEYDEELQNLQLAALETELAIKQSFGDQDIALSGRIMDAKIANEKHETEEKKKLEQQKVDAVQSTLGQVAGLFNKNSIAFKALASAQALIQTYQSAQAVFTGMTSTIPGPVGIALGIAGAAAAIISGIARVNQINSVKTPKLAQGGIIDIAGKTHGHGGEDVAIGGKVVANVEGGEKMAIIKRGADIGLLRHLSTINRLAGGRDFFNDRTPRYVNADGGMIARGASNPISGFQNLSLTENLKNLRIYTRLTDLERVQGESLSADFTSELRG
jgi:hypothetical protein